MFVVNTSGSLFAQQSQIRIDSNDLKLMYEFEDSLEKIALKVQRAEKEGDRLKASHNFIPHLVKALRTPYSFDYSFSNLNNISVLNAPDNRFRIFTWKVLFDDLTSRYFGSVQFNTEDGNLMLIPLVDFRDSLENHTQEILSNLQWHGAVYYNIKHVQANGKDYYTLFGFVGKDYMSQMKLMEIMHFDENTQEIVFGAPIIQSKQDKEQTLNRFFIEYTRDATATLNFNREMNMVIFDHLIPPNPNNKGLYFTYIPDGSYEGYKLKDNMWKYVEDAFPELAEDVFENPPIPQPQFKNRKKRDMPDFR
ncbi:MAG: hypothetical protein EA412_14160 [Chitinophagaceae bacterium]|nr:MAG: hypothetical protein EA412_14160 [Chitinophagaceae bacterium]